MNNGFQIEDRVQCRYTTLTGTVIGKDDAGFIQVEWDDRKVTWTARTTLNFFTHSEASQADVETFHTLTLTTEQLQALVSLFSDCDVQGEDDPLFPVFERCVELLGGVVDQMTLEASSDSFQGEVN